MKVRLEQLRQAIGAMSREDLEQLAEHVVISLYGSTFTTDDDAWDAELVPLNLQDGDIYLDADKDISADTAYEVRDDLKGASLTPEQL